MVTSPWFLSQRPADDAAATRLFCFPFAGVGASVYRGWADAMGPECDVRIVQLPGREGRLRERPLLSIDELVSQLREAIAPLLDKRYALFGHSLGGLVAFELLRELREEGLPAPARLFISASRAPHLQNPYPPLRHLPDLELLQKLDQRYGGSVPRDVMQSAELRELLVPPLRADLTVLETYRYQPAAPFSHGISIFGGSTDSTLTRRSLDAWQAHTSSSHRVRMIEGGHLYLQHARSVLATAIREDLCEAPEAAVPVMRRPSLSAGGAL